MSVIERNNKRTLCKDTWGAGRLGLYAIVKLSSSAYYRADYCYYNTQIFGALQKFDTVCEQKGDFVIHHPKRKQTPIKFR